MILNEFVRQDYRIHKIDFGARGATVVLGLSEE